MYVYVYMISIGLKLYITNLFGEILSDISEVCSTETKEEP